MNITPHQQNYDVSLYKTDFSSSFVSFFSLLVNAVSVGWTERKEKEKKKRKKEKKKEKKKKKKKKKRGGAEC